MGDFMNDDEIKLGRKKCTNFLKRRKKYLEKKDRLYELLKEPLIKEYLDIAVFLSEHTDEEFDETMLKIKAFDKLAKKTEHTYGIYMYVGKENNTNKILLVDIENLRKIKISYDSFETLKQNKKIIYIENKNNEPDFYDKKIIEVRNEYLCSLKELDQESAKNKILEKLL